MTDSKDPFGFSAIADDGAGGLDLSDFAPSNGATVDRNVAAIAREVAAEHGFQSRAPARAPETFAPAPVAPPSKTGGRRRLRISEVIQDDEDARSDENRVQLNISAPVSVAQPWKALEKATGLRSWQLLERAIAHLEDDLESGRLPRVVRGRGS